MKTSITFQFESKDDAVKLMRAIGTGPWVVQVEEVDVDGHKEYQVISALTGVALCYIAQDIQDFGETLEESDLAG